MSIARSRLSSKQVALQKKDPFLLQDSHALPTNQRDVFHSRTDSRPQYSAFFLSRRIRIRRRGIYSSPAKLIHPFNSSPPFSSLPPPVVATQSAEGEPPFVESLLLLWLLARRRSCRRCLAKRVESARARCLQNCLYYSVCTFSNSPVFRAQASVQWSLNFCVSARWQAANSFRWKTHKKNFPHLEHVLSDVP